MTQCVRRGARRGAGILTGLTTLALVAGGAATATARPAGPAPSARTSPPQDTLFPDQGTSAFDVTRYDVAMSYVPATNRLRATTTVEARSHRRLRSVTLDLEGLKVDGVRAGGAPATWTRHGDHLVIRARHRLGRSFSVQVTYAGVPREHTDTDGSSEGWVRTSDGAIGLGEPVGTMTWVPCNNTPGDKALWSYRVTVPHGYQVAANGDLAARAEHGDRTTWVWRGKDPMATYLATIGVGHFRVHHSRIRSVDGRALPAWSFIDPTSGSAAKAQAQLPSVLGFEERLFGPYPFSSTGMIVDDAQVGYALETQTRPFYPASASVSVLVHEMAHQWYGDSVSVTDWHDVWLAEGFATYAEWLWDDAHGDQTTQQHFDALYARPASDPLWRPAPAQFTKRADLFGDPVYLRGAMTLQSLRDRIGDADFFALLKTWAADRRHGNARSADFERVAERVSGEDLAGLFHDWLVQDGKPTG